MPEDEPTIDGPLFEEPPDSSGDPPESIAETLAHAAAPARWSDASLEPGTRIAGFTIRRLLGEGGMGSVYLADQDRPSRRVALKLMRAGRASPAILRRFEHEAEVLARLQHPGIAHIHEAGLHGDDGGAAAPYFAMEFVDGPSLTAYAAERGLDARARLALFASVCDAVHHAHTKGIVHRDLKPANILVAEQGDPSEPRPKILDFGVARLTDSDLQTTTMHTEVGQIIGTLPYMSPEQVGGQGADLDTRSDVYALGVVLYELLSGRLPYDLERRLIPEAARIIREEDHTRLASLDTRLRGDIETIVGKALEKAPERRYQSALEMAQDIRRYLADQPIAARPPSTLYQLRKFSKRNKVLVTGVAGIILALAVGLAAAAYGLVEANDQRAIAEHRADEAEAARAEALRTAEQLQVVAEFQAEQLGSIDAAAMGLGLREALRDRLTSMHTREGVNAQTSTLRLAEFDSLIAGVDLTGLAMETIESNILAPSLDAIDRTLSDQPLVRAALLHTVARSADDLGLPQLALEPQREALRLRHEWLGPDHPLTLNAAHRLGVLLMEMGRPEEAEPILASTMEARLRVLGAEHTDTLNTLSACGMVSSDLGRIDEAEATARQVLEAHLRLRGSDDPATLTALSNLAVTLRERGAFDEAQSMDRSAVEGNRRTRGGEHPATLGSLMNAGSGLRDMGRFEEAEPLLREALETRRRVLGDDHPDTLVSVASVALLLRGQGRLEDAERAYRELVDTSRRVLGASHPDTLRAILMLAGVLRERGALAEAEPMIRAVVEAQRRTLGTEHEATLSAMNSLSTLIWRQGRPTEAEPMSRAVLAGYRRVLGDMHPDTQGAIGNLGVLLYEQGKLAEAEPLFREALAGYRSTLGDDHPRTIGSINNLGVLLRSLGQLEEAEALGREAVQRGRAVLGQEHYVVGNYLQHQARTLLAMGRFAEAEHEALEARRLLVAGLGAEHARSRAAAELLDDLYTAWHAADPDAGHDAKAGAWRAVLDEAPGVEDPSD